MDTPAHSRKGAGYSEVRTDASGSLPTSIGTSSGVGNNRKKSLTTCVAVIVSFLVGIYLGGRSSETVGTTVDHLASPMHNHQSSGTNGENQQQQQHEGVAGGGGGAILVTGATGRLGSLLYHELKRRGLSDVRAFVRNVTKARTILGCDKCDETEGIYVGDVTKRETLDRAMSDGSVTALAIATGGSRNDTEDMRRKIHSDSVVYSVNALANSHNESRKHLRVVLCSSMGTNRPPQEQPSFFSDVLYWKLNSEAFLSASAIPNTVIVKPCGLRNGMAGKNSTLLVGHNGTITEGSPHHWVSREDVASVMAESVMLSNECGRSTSLRFDLCSKPGPATTDLKGLIDSARWA